MNGQHLLDIIKVAFGFKSNLENPHDLNIDILISSAARLFLVVFILSFLQGAFLSPSRELTEWYATFLKALLISPLSIWLALASTAAFSLSLLARKKKWIKFSRFLVHLSRDFLGYLVLLTAAMLALPSGLMVAFWNEPVWQERESILMLLGVAVIFLALTTLMLATAIFAWDENYENIKISSLFMILALLINSIAFNKFMDIKILSLMVAIFCAFVAFTLGRGKKAAVPLSTYE